MLARRYDGQHGHGRIADFVIHNEVNANDWYDIGCGQGTPCNTDAWVARYAADYNAAYDAIKAEQPFAKVLISFEHHFGTSYAAPSAQNPLLSVQTFLTRLAPQLLDRDWQVAYHPYPPNLFSPVFGPFDWPRVLEVNVMGTVTCTLAARPHMQGRAGASIVNIASSAAHLSRATAYGNSKLAVAGLTLTFAAELGAEGIRVNAISPGLIFTDTPCD